MTITISRVAPVRPEPPGDMTWHPTFLLTCTHGVDRDRSFCLECGK